MKFLDQVNKHYRNIDKDDIVDLDTCVEVTNIINPILDESNIIDDSYILDITTKEKGEK